MRLSHFRLRSERNRAGLARRVTPGVVSVLVMAACSAAAPSVTPTAVPSQAPTAALTPTPVPTSTVAPAPSGTTLMHDGFMHPGMTYATAAFGVRFTLAVPSNMPDDTWLSSSTGLARQLHVGQPAQEGVGMTFYLPTGGFDATGASAALPSDFVAWLSSDAQLKVTASKAVTVGGLPATRLEVAADPSKIPAPPGECPVNSACVLVASTSPDAPLRPMLVFPGNPAAVYVINLPSGGQLLINLDAGTTLKDSDALLQSLQFVSP